MPGLFVPPIDRIYKETELCKSPCTNGLTEADFDPNAFVPMAINYVEHCPVSDLMIATIFAQAGQIVENPPMAMLERVVEQEGMEEMFGEDMAEVRAGLLQAITAFQPGTNAYMMAWQIMIYLGCRCITEDNARFAQDLKELGIV